MILSQDHTLHRLPITKVKYTEYYQNVSQKNKSYRKVFSEDRGIIPQVCGVRRVQYFIS